MLAIHAFTPLPDDEQAPRRRANPAFNRLVHAYSDQARPRLPHLSREEELELISIARDLGCTQSMDRLIETHMGFLTNIANRAAKLNGLEDHRDDLYSEAVEGFMAAVKTYDPARNARLSTHSKYAVTGRCYRYVMDMKHPFRVGTNLPDKKAFFNLSRLRAEFFEIYGRAMRDTDADIEDAAMVSGIPARAIKRSLLLEAGGPAFSPEDIQIHDMRPQDRPENRLSRKSGQACVQHHIHKVADSLIDRDRDILLTVLADPDKPADGARICSERHAISVERVRQIVRGAVKDIRASLAADGYSNIADVI